MQRYVARLCMPPTMPTLYEILEVPTGASTADISSAYRRLALECHPDKCLGDPSGAPERFLRLEEAQSLLSDASQRCRYDVEVLGLHRTPGSSTSSADVNFTDPSEGRPSTPAFTFTLYRHPGWRMWQMWETWSDAPGHANECILPGGQACSEPSPMDLLPVSEDPLGTTFQNRRLKLISRLAKAEDDCGGVAKSLKLRVPQEDRNFWRALIQLNDSIWRCEEIISKLNVRCGSCGRSEVAQTWHGRLEAYLDAVEGLLVTSKGSRAKMIPDLHSSYLLSDREEALTALGKVQTAFVELIAKHPQL